MAACFVKLLVMDVMAVRRVSAVKVTLLCSSLLCDCEVSLLVTSRAVDSKQRLTAAVSLHLARHANLHSGAPKEATRDQPVSDFDPVPAGQLVCTHTHRAWILKNVNSEAVTVLCKHL